MLVTSGQDAGPGEHPVVALPAQLRRNWASVDLLLSRDPRLAQKWLGAGIVLQVVAVLVFAAIHPLVTKHVGDALLSAMYAPPWFCFFGLFLSSVRVIVGNIAVFRYKRAPSWYPPSGQLIATLLLRRVDVVVQLLGAVVVLSLYVRLGQ